MREMGDNREAKRPLASGSAMHSNKLLQYGLRKRCALLCISASAVYEALSYY
jgi:hypothetical protein